MKKRILCLLLVMMMGVTALMAEENKPKIAVVAFSINDTRNSKLVNDASAVRNQVQANIVKTGQYDVIAREEIDKLLENQKIQANSISSSENIKKLKLLNISYIVTGTVDAVDNDYVVTISMLDVSNGKFTFSDEEFMSNSSQKMYTGTKTLTERFIKRLENSSGGVKVVAEKVEPKKEEKKYKIGDIGPGGGIVFYLKGESHGMECSNVLGDFLWGDAMNEASYYNGGGYNNWALPSKDELNMIYINLKCRGYIYDSVWFWSSSSYGSNSAWAQNFSDGRQGHNNDFKNSYCSVRAVRAF